MKSDRIKPNERGANPEALNQPNWRFTCVKSESKPAGQMTQELTLGAPSCYNYKKIPYFSTLVSCHILPYSANDFSLDHSLVRHSHRSFHPVFLCTWNGPPTAPWKASNYSPFLYAIPQDPIEETQPAVKGRPRVIKEF